MVEWTGLGKQYGRRRLFADLSGKLEPGCTLVVTGRNGSGKSTFLRLLAGLTKQDAGEIRRTDEVQIGYASPEIALYGELTGLENLQFYSQVRGSDASLLGEPLERAGLSKAAGKPVAQYSSGMRQRLKLLVATIHQPDVLLLDEPTLALDIDGIAFVDATIAAHISRGGCLAIATNDGNEAERWAMERLDLGGMPLANAEISSAR